MIWKRRVTQGLIFWERGLEYVSGLAAGWRWRGWKLAACSVAYVVTWIINHVSNILSRGHDGAEIFIPMIRGRARDKYLFGT